MIYTCIVDVFPSPGCQLCFVFENHLSKIIFQHRGVSLARLEVANSPQSQNLEKMQIKLLRLNKSYIFIDLAVKTNWVDNYIMCQNI